MTEQEREFQKKALGEAGISYSVSTALPVIFSLVVVAIGQFAVGEGYDGQTWYKYLCYLIPQICFALTAVIFFKRSRVSVRRTFCGCKWYYFPVAVLLQFGLFFSLSELNVYFLKFLALFGYESAESSLPPLGGWNLLPAILVIAVLPALFEETLFRGILSRSMFADGWGVAATVLISGALFSLFHHNPEQTIYQFICGVCFTLVAVRSGSVFPTVVAHFLNNALILIINSIYAPNGGDVSWLDIMSKGAYIAVVVVSAVCLAGTLVFLVFFDKRNAQRGGVKHGKLFFLFAGIGMIICAVEWVAQLIAGFL